MIKTVQGSLDGLTVQQLDVGAEYDTVDSPRGERLAKYHVNQGVAVILSAAALAKRAKRKASK